MIATPDQLRELLGEDATSLPDAQAMLLLELAGAEVKAAAGQELERVTDDAIEILGTTEAWLVLPQRPVTDVTSVTIDGGDAINDYKRFGARLWRKRGWATCTSEPSTVAIIYSHGYPAGDPALDLAEKMTLGIAANLHASPVPAIAGVSIDDYREQLVQSGGDRPDMLPVRSQRLLRYRYGVRAGLVRIGG